jgi:hypothetical protein
VIGEDKRITCEGPVRCRVTGAAQASRIGFTSAGAVRPNERFFQAR